MNVSEAICQALDQAALERSPNTVRAYRLGSDVFCAFLAGNKVDPEKMEIKDISVDLFIRFPSYLVSKYERPTAAVYMAAVMYIWNWFMIWDYITPNFNQTVKLKKAIEMAHFSQGKNTRLPAKGSMEKMIEAAGKITDEEPLKSRNIAIVLLLASSGCRNSEATGLVVKDLDFEQRQAYITETKNDDPRLIFFSQEAAEAIKKYWSERGYANKTDPVFCRHDKGAGYGKTKKLPITTSTVRNVVDAVSKVAGIDQFTPHYFRHAFAIKSLEESGNLALVQDLLGHRTPTSTRVYAKIYDEDLRDAHHRIFK